MGLKKQEAGGQVCTCDPIVISRDSQCLACSDYKGHLDKDVFILHDYRILLGMLLMKVNILSPKALEQD